MFSDRATAIIESGDDKTKIRFDIGKGGTYVVVLIYWGQNQTSFADIFIDYGVVDISSLNWEEKERKHTKLNVE